MPQTFYVTQDEEILSLVGRLRSSALLENVFVVPKRALILQSIVNLRILAREAEKLGKMVTIVTQDEDGRMLAEKAGILTKLYSEENLRANERISEAALPQIPTGTSIGSSDFFSGAPVSASSQPISLSPSPAAERAPIGSAPSEVKLRIRSNDPKRLTALNSMATAEAGIPLEGGDNGIIHPGSRAAGSAAIRPLSIQPSERPRMQPPSAAAYREPAPVPRPMGAIPPERRAAPGGGHADEGRLAQVFRANTTEREQERAASFAAAKKSADRSGHIGGRGKFWFFLFAGISILSLSGTGLFLFLPKAEIIAVPQSVSQDIEMEFEGRTEPSGSDREIPGRIIEREEEVTVSLETSGTSAGNGTKARGTIVISNAFGSDPQPLVATTRFQTEDGKIFRLAKGVTVPGISEIDGKKESGAIEADVIADEAGESHDIGPSSFTIPGFKGSEKYVKITAKSKNPMTGGSSEGEASNKTVSSDDIGRAKEEAENRFRSMFEEAIRSEAAEGESFLPESVMVSPVGTASYPQAGVAASSFEYKAKFKGIAFVFSESALKEKAAAFLRKKANLDDLYETRDISIEYGDAVPGADRGVMYLKVRATGLFVSKIDQEKLRQDFLGKKSDGIKEALENHPEIKNIEVYLKPKFFTFSVPNDPDRVTVIIEEP